MGMRSHRGLSFSIFCPLGLPLEALGRSVGRDVVMKAGGAVGLGCRRLGWSVPRGQWLVVWMNGRGTCRLGKGDGPQGCTASVLIWFSNKLVSPASHFFISWMSCSNTSWTFSMALIRTSHQSLILLTFENKFDIKYFTLCFVWCMHDVRNMRWHVMLINA